MIIILSPQANILKKENDSSMQYVLNQLLSNKEGIETKVIDRTYINNFVFKFQFINKILSKIFILKYWYISYLSVKKLKAEIIITTSQEYILPFYKNKQHLILHDIIQYFRPRNIKYFIFYKLYIIKLIPSLKNIYSVSKFTAKLTSKVCNIKFKDIKYIEIDKFINNKQKKLNYQGIPKTIDILWIGNNSKHKRLDFFIESLILLSKKTNKNLKICILTPEHINESSRKQIEESKIKNKFDIDFKIKVSDKEINNLYKKSKIFISTSELEGYCLPIRESYYFGCISIAPNKKIFREIHGKYCLLFSSYSTKSLACKIQKAIKEVHMLSNKKKLNLNLNPISDININNFLKYLSN